MSRHSLPAHEKIRYDILSAGQTGGLIVREITEIKRILNWTLSSEGFTNFQVIDDGTFRLSMTSSKVLKLL